MLPSDSAGNGTTGTSQTRVSHTSVSTCISHKRSCQTPSRRAHAQHHVEWPATSVKGVKAREDSARAAMATDADSRAVTVARVVDLDVVVVLPIDAFNLERRF